MSTGNPTQELFDLWRKSVDEGTQAWVRALGAPPAGPPPPFDFAQFWRPILGQGMDVWQKAAAQGGIGPEFMAQWKGLMDQTIDAWARALGQAMATEGFAQALGRHLDQWLAVQAPVKKGLEQYNDMALRTLGLPSRAQVVGVASQLVALEERIEGLEERLAEVKEAIADTKRAVLDHESAAARRAAPPDRREASA
ncbi:MAG: hypothetical protein ACREMB_21305 [Candidatus Rokuibacteriota bacterium]